MRERMREDWRKILRNKMNVSKISLESVEKIRGVRS